MTSKRVECGGRERISGLPFQNKGDHHMASIELLRLLGDWEFMVTPKVLVVDVDNVLAFVSRGGADAAEF